MTKAEELDWIYRLRSNIYVYMPKEWLIPMDNALDSAIKALEKEPCEDVMVIHTQGLDEGIRCAMCTNSMKSDRGCDGGCVVNEAMYKEVMNTIRNHIVPPVTLTRKKERWIPVSERMPEDGELVLFSTNTDRVYEGRFFVDNTDFQWYAFRDEAFACNNVVTAWLPLPEPYKEAMESEE